MTQTWCLNLDQYVFVRDGETPAALRLYELIYGATTVNASSTVLIWYIPRLKMRRALASSHSPNHFLWIYTYVLLLWRPLLSCFSRLWYRLRRSMPSFPPSDIYSPRRAQGSDWSIPLLKNLRKPFACLWYALNAPTTRHAIGLILLQGEEGLRWAATNCAASGSALEVESEA